MSCSACRLCRTFPPLCRALPRGRSAEGRGSGHLPGPPSSNGNPTRRVPQPWGALCPRPSPHGGAPCPGSKARSPKGVRDLPTPHSSLRRRRWPRLPRTPCEGLGERTQRGGIGPALAAMTLRARTAPLRGLRRGQGSAGARFECPDDSDARCLPGGQCVYRGAFQGG